MASASILLAAVSAQTIIHTLLLFLLVLPFSLDVVLRDGSAGFSVLFVVNKVWHVAELVAACHTKVHTLFFQRLFATLIGVLVDFIVLAAVFCRTSIVFVPTQTTFWTFWCGALAFSEAWSCFSPHKFVRAVIIVIWVVTVACIAIIILVSSISPL